MRTATNFFLGNLAVADLCVGIFCIIPNLLLYLSPYWYLGKVMCKLLYFVQMMSYAASITILTVISVERYFAILHPLRCKTWKRLWLLRLAVVIIWATSAVTGIPHLILRDAVTTSGLSFCIVVNVEFDRQAYVTTNFIVWYVVPLCLMSLMYSKISIVLWNTSKLDRFSTNALKKWRHQKKVTYTYTSNSEAPDQGRCYAPNGQAYGGSSGGPRISIEDEYPVERTSSSVGSSEEAPGCALPSNVTCGTTWRSSRCSGLNSDPCSDLLSVQTSSLQVTPNEDVLNSSTLLAYKDLIPPRKGSNANPNKVNVVTPDLNMVLNQYTSSHSGSAKSPTGLVPDSNHVTPTHEPSSTTDESQKTQETPVKPLAPNGRISSHWDKIIKKVHKPFLGQWPLQRAETALLARRRVIRLLMIVIACFAVCVLPYHLQMLINEWSHTEPSFLQELINPITFLIFYSNSALNPILYAFLSDNFRKSLCELLSNRGCCRRQAYRQPPVVNNLTSRPTPTPSKPTASPTPSPTPNRQPVNQ